MTPTRRPSHARRVVQSVLPFLLAWLSAVGHPVFAQTLFLIDSGAPECAPTCRVVPRLLEIDVAAARVRHVREIPVQSSRAMTVTADGRYVVWSGYGTVRTAASSLIRESVAVLDTVTAVVSEHFVALRSILSAPAASTVVAHPGSLGLVAQVAGGAPFAWNGTTVLPFDPGQIGQVLLDISASGEVLLVSAPNAVRIYDSVSVVLRHQWTRPAFPITHLALTPDGTEVVTMGYAAPNGLFSRRRAADGVVVTQAALPMPVEAVPRALAVDPRLGHLWVAHVNGEVTILDRSTFAVLRRLPAALQPVASPGPSTSVVFDRDHPRAYVLTTRQQGSAPPVPLNAPYVVRIDVVDTGSLAVIGSGTLVTDGAPSSLALVPTPPAPTSLAASVVGDRVTLQWQPGPGAGVATGYRLEAGSAPGAGGLAVFETIGTSLSVAGVPPGTYYVRVRATNYGGASDASGEIVVTVP